MTDEQPVTIRLKRLREATSPKFTVRDLADVLGMPPSSYAAYEDPKKFKKKLLPVELTKKIAEEFAPRGIDSADVLALAGLNGSGALIPEPEELADRLDAVMLREIDVSYALGGGAEIDELPVIRMVPFSRNWLRSLTSSPSSDLVVARGDGDSMMPTILDQDLVIIDLAQKTIRQQDRIWALAYGHLGMIKRVRALPDGSYQINSDNHAVSSIQANDDEMVTVGRVVAIIRRI